MPQPGRRPETPPTPGAPTGAELDRRAMLEKNLERQTEWIRNSDVKIAMLLPINTALIAVLASQLDEARQAVHWVLVIATSVPTLVSFGSAVLAAMPQFRHIGDSLIYFGDVAHHSREVFHDRVLNLTPEAHFEDLAEQVHFAAFLAQRKYRHVRNAYVALLIALPFWTAALYLLNHPP
jgi:hypothetical protein